MHICVRKILYYVCRNQLLLCLTEIHYVCGIITLKVADLYHICGLLRFRAVITFAGVTVVKVEKVTMILTCRSFLKPTVSQDKPHSLKNFLSDAKGC